MVVHAAHFRNKHYFTETLEFDLLKFVLLENNILMHALCKTAKETELFIIKLKSSLLSLPHGYH